ncbi:MAG: hypothetical protein HOP23_16535 [Methylococcaceae bacterium]|nr:hypothetical protein [Methylococcaceae bacterium]
MKKLCIPAFCLLHMIAIFWWTLPHSFGAMIVANDKQASLEAKLFNWLILEENSKAYTLLRNYIDVTGSQQYWDFFAPQIPIVHQYLSVCNSIMTYPQQEQIACQGQALFSNLQPDFAMFRRFGSDRSRLYRLTENLIHLDDPLLLETFTNYYRARQQRKAAQLIQHRFELHPELKDLPKAGYQMDKLLWTAP